MTTRAAATRPTVAVTVELFGTARIKAGVAIVPLRVNAGTTVAELARALARECPALLGNALRDDDGIGIADGYALNLNGLTFLPSDTGQRIRLQDGDTLLLLSSQAGG